MPDKTASSAAKFLLEDVIEPCPYLIEYVYSDNGTEYKGTPHHPFGFACFQNGINQKFTQPAHPQTNGKAERVIRTLMEMWHDKTRLILTQSKSLLTKSIKNCEAIKPKFLRAKRC